MCQAMEEYTKKTKVEGAITVLRGIDTKESDIIAAIVKQFENVTPEYVKDLLAPRAEMHPTASSARR